MTPQEYLKIERRQHRIIAAAQQRIEDARRKANLCPIPKNLRPAEADDITPSAIIWHEGEAGGHFWNIVDEPLHRGDPFKAYVADDGCRYGLHGAYVEVGPA